MKKIFAALLMMCLVSSVQAVDTAVQLAPPYNPPVATGKAEVALGKDGADLSGTWTLRLDDQQEPKGLEREWYQESGFEEKIDLPDALQNAGFGDPVTPETEWIGGSGTEQWFTSKYDRYRKPGNVKVPFCLQPERRYLGQAWYQKTVTLSEEAPVDHELILTLERPHWFSTVWLNGEKVGTDDSLSVSHVYNLQGKMKVGKNSLVVMVDNRYLIPVGHRAHCVSDETQGAWNGIIGDMKLEWRSPVYIESIKTFPDYQTKSARIAIVVQNTTKQAQKLKLSVQGAVTDVSAKPGLTRHEKTVKFGDDASLWNEFTPVLHPVKVSLKSDLGNESQTVQVGIRNIETEGKKILVNGRETFLRGTLDCAIFPKTGYPPTGVEDWLIHLGKMRDSGINHVRFHSWCPPRAAFVAADQLGMYLLPEAGLWLREVPTGKLAEWVYKECKRILDAYGNHPSFMFFTHGNEPIRHGNMKEFVQKLTRDLREYDHRMLHTASASFFLTDEDEFTVNSQPRGRRGWKGIGFKVDADCPRIQHEPGQHCVYPNFDEMVKYTGPLKPKNFEIFMEQVQENGLFDQWREFHDASGKLQVICYKADCEAALISEDIAGTQLLGISDFSGQGTALVGYLDAFYDEKTYFTKKEFSRFWSHSVPLARMKRFTFKNSEKLDVEILYAYFGAEDLSGQTLLWEIADSTGNVRLSGAFKDINLKNGRTAVGKLQEDLSALKSPENYTLTLKLQGTDISNRWDFWVYEDNPEISPGDVMVSRDLDAATKAALEAGKSVLLFPENYSRAHVNMSLEPVFWSRFMFSHHSSRALGLLIKNDHPALASFPSKVHSDWNWEEILPKSHGLVMENLPREGIIVQPIDDWNSNRLLGYIFEYKVGQGRLLVCMPHLPLLSKKYLAAGQLYSSILKYMNTKDFSPTTAVKVQDLEDAFEFISQKSKLIDMGARPRKTNMPSPRLAKIAIDGDPGTCWMSPMNKGGAFVILDLGSTQSLQGIRVDNTNMKQMSVSMGDSVDGLKPVKFRNTPGASADVFTFSKSYVDDSMNIPFSEERSGRYLKIQVSEVYGGGMQLGELDIIKIFE